MEKRGRPLGSLGATELRERVRIYEAAVKEGRLQAAQIAARNLPAAMKQAALAVEKHGEDWRAAFMKRQENKGVPRKAARRKMAKAQSQRDKVAAAEAACKEAQQQGGRVL